MNIRQLLHTIAVVATAVGAGTLFDTSLLGSASHAVTAACLVIALFVNTYMGFTTTGEAK